MKSSFSLVILLLAMAPASLFAELIQIQSPAGVAVRLDESSGIYEIIYRPAGWTFSGRTGQPLSNVTTNRGSDYIGPYTEISWPDRFSVQAGIRVYDAQPAVLFTVTKAPLPFPDFTVFPTLHPFSFGEVEFAPAHFDLEQNGTPWMLFDDSANAVILSPADHFLIASMNGDGVHEIASGLNTNVHIVPPDFSHSTLMVFGAGIRATWKTWSDAFLACQGVTRPDNEADPGLRYLGYWTDNGATYYYNYNTNSSYAATLEKLVARYRDEGIPIRYLQLDSWWYEKTFTGLDGKPGKTKNPRLPQGEWNRYGGLLAYRADPAVLPDGLDGFQKQVSLPLITHNRWVDPASPYHQKYAISGIAAVDPKYWDDVLSYIAHSGVSCYEQDWLNEIYAHSPQLQSVPGVADAFADNMAQAARENHLSLQYCMALPRFFLQGSRYPNLTTIRTSEDHFQRSRWDAFLFTSQLARAVGIWPWTDVFMSTERNNLLISVLSAGMVGIGDRMGRESKENLSYAARADGVLVKPDESLLPADDVYLSQAQGKKNPMIAWTYTDHGTMRTGYVFAYVRDPANPAATFKPSDFGLSGQVYVLNTRMLDVSLQDAGQPVHINFGSDGTAYYEVVPVGKSGIAFFGDRGKYVSNGCQRIAGLAETNGKLTATITFAAGEKSANIFGFAREKPEVSAQSGSVENLYFDKKTGCFNVNVMPDRAISTSAVDPVQTAVIRLSEP